MVLLGDFNGQRLESSVRDLVRKRLLLDPTDRHEIRDLHSESGVGVTKDVQVLLRVTPGVEYVKVSKSKGTWKPMHLPTSCGRIRKMTFLCIRETSQPLVRQRLRMDAANVSSRII